MIDLECHVNLIALAAAIEQRIIEDLISFNAFPLHFIEEDKRLFNVSLFAEAFDHRRIGNQIGSDRVRMGRGTHLGEYFFCLGKVVATNAAVEERVECHVIRLYLTV